MKTVKAVLVTEKGRQPAVLSATDESSEPVLLTYTPHDLGLLGESTARMYDLMQVGGPSERVINLMPTELIAFGEHDVLRSLETKPPDFVLLVSRDTSEYGSPLFGSDQRYGQRTVMWIEERYESLRVIRKDARSDSEIAMRVLRRRGVQLGR